MLLSGEPTIVVIASDRGRVSFSQRLCSDVDLGVLLLFDRMLRSKPMRDISGDAGLVCNFWVSDVEENRHDGPSEGGGCFGLTMASRFHSCIRRVGHCGSDGQSDKYG